MLGTDRKGGDDDGDSDAKNMAILTVTVVAMGDEFNEDSEDFARGYLIKLDAK